MPFNAKNSGGADFEQPNPGNYPAVCVQVIDLGMQERKWQDVKSMSRQCRISWELPGQLMKDGNTPFMVSKFYTVSTNKKSNMRPDFESWRGKAFTEDEINCFDMFTIAGTACLLNCVSKQKTSGGTTIVVTGITPLPAAMAHLVGSLHNSIQKFSVDDYNDGDALAIETLDGLTDWLKGKINLDASQLHGVKAEPYEPHTGTAESENPAEGQDKPFVDDEELPF